MSRIQPRFRYRPERTSRAASGRPVSTPWPMPSTRVWSAEDLVTQAAERLYTARFQLGLFDPPGSSLDRIPFQSVASNPHRLISRKAAEESIVLLKNNGALPLKSDPGHIAVIGPTADQLTSILGNYVGTPLHPVTPLEGIESQFRSLADSLRAGLDPGRGRGSAGSAHGVRSEQGAQNRVLRHARLDRPPGGHRNRTAVQTDWENAKPVPQIDTFDYSVRWTGTLSVPAPGHYVFSLEPGDSFPYSPAESYRFVLDGKVLSEGSLRAGMDMSAMGNFKAAPGASPTAPPIMKFPKPAEIAVDFSDTKPTRISAPVFPLRRSGRRRTDAQVAGACTGPARRGRRPSQRSRRGGGLRGTLAAA